MTEILAISKATKDVLTATDPNDFLFHSGYNTFKILAEGTASSQTVDGHPKTFALAHGLPEAPTFYAFAEFPDGKVVSCSEHSIDFTTQPFVDDGYGQFTVEVDATYLYFIFNDTFLAGFSGNYNVNIKYYIFEAPI